MAKAEGLAAADLKISAVGGAPARQVMLKEGKIDAGMQPLPLNLEAEALGFTNLGWAGKYEPEWQFTPSTPTATGPATIHASPPGSCGRCCAASN